MKDLDTFGEAETDDEDFEEECRRIMESFKIEAGPAYVDEEELNEAGVGEVIFRTPLVGDRVLRD